jgi:hypothetical protein
MPEKAWDEGCGEEEEAPFLCQTHVSKDGLCIGT